MAEPVIEVRINNAPNTYAFQLLQHVLSPQIQSKPYHVVYADLEHISEERRTRLLADGENVDVMALTVSEARLQELQAIQIPLLYGLTGLRILLTTAESQSTLSSVNSLESLRKLNGVFVYGWADSDVFKANHLNVYLAVDRDQATAVLANQRAHYFPRAASEIYDNFNLYQTEFTNLAIEPEVALYYPMPLYYFVARQNAELAKDIQTGLQTLIQSGEMRALFEQSYGAVLQQLAISHRTIIELDNPFLPDNIALPKIGYIYQPLTDGLRF